MFVPLIGAVPRNVKACLLFEVLGLKEGEEKGKRGRSVCLCYSYIIAGEAALLFLRGVHFKVSGCIPETRLRHLENKRHRGKTTVWERRPGGTL